MNTCGANFVLLFVSDLQLGNYTRTDYCSDYRSAFHSDNVVGSRFQRCQSCKCAVTCSFSGNIVLKQTRSFYVAMPQGTAGKFVSFLRANRVMFSQFPGSPDRRGCATVTNLRVHFV